ncbi:MAG: 16S rRNA (adenine(1518)-N(6)/adenine(1519)-N(6))-dimethyltransferase RsmA [Arcobacteraceae bacterium]|jgi:16S rRNA (adenine1518-N6/adenine1519-N6)-dimethyltransferase|nr:16S rRNA (adenine(1518)-N(6)/adenine(1519)-N(6))-dimethyltransferase RsmA [Arcobacteraceae bacterium]
MIKAKKKYGQNFLKDESVVLRIIESMPKNNNKVVEIGPGLGDLTKQLVKYKDVRAYEVDRDLYSILRVEFINEINSGRLDLVLTDVLEVWNNNSSLYEEKYDLIANLPYYIATNIILNAFSDNNCENIIVMVQKEVADKFTVTSGDSDFSALGVIAELLCLENKIIIEVPPESFSPPPKVDSSVIYLKKDMTKTIDSKFNKFLKVAFAQPRKKLIKNLSAAYNKDVLSTLFIEFNINENIRPHELSSSLYSQIYTSL